MASLDSLPPDQKAVLSLVLQRGRGYDEIAAMLAIDRAAVRDRALQGFDALGPSTTVGAPQRALITDYLLGQLPPAIAKQVRDRLAGSPPERAWARVISAEIGPLAKNPLPEIPAAATRVHQPEPAAKAKAKADAEPTPDPESKAPRSRRQATPADRDPEGPDDAPVDPAPADADRTQPTSRRGGAILLGVLAIVIIAVVVVVILTSGNSSPSTNATAPPATTSTGTASAASSTPSTTGTDSGTGSGTSTTPKPTVLKTINLLPPSGAKSPAGVAEVARDSGKLGLVLYATNLAANTKNAYAVWLFNAKTQKSSFLGFDPNKVVATGKAKGVMEVETALPSTATSYDELLITVETQEHPTKPGTTVLEGSFSE